MTNMRISHPNYPEKWKKRKINWYVTASSVLNILFGALLMINPEYCVDAACVDLGLIGEPLGFVFLLIGIVFLWLSLTRIASLADMKVICPQCEGAWNGWDLAELRCPNDGSELEPLDGFFDRHPERRGKGNSKNN